MRAVLDVECVPVRELHLQRALDIDIFLAARAAGAVVMTKDADFEVLVGQHGPPPQVVLVTCGNTSNTRLREVVGAQWATGANHAGAGRTPGGTRRTAASREGVARFEASGNASESVQVRQPNADLVPTGAVLVHQHSQQVLNQQFALGG